MKYIMIFVFLIAGFGTAFSQVPVDPLRYKEFGFNMTGLVSNFIPFNSTKLGLQRYAFSYKFTRIRKKTSKLSTLRLGIGLDNILDDTEAFNFNFRLGVERKQILSDKWTFITGNDFILLLEPININASEEFFEDTPRIGIGYSRPFGIEFHLNNRISIYTETALQITAGFPPIAVRIVPPASIFLNVRM